MLFIFFFVRFFVYDFWCDFSCVIFRVWICGTVVPQQVDLFGRGEVWRRIELSCTRNRTLGGQ